MTAIGFLEALALGAVFGAGLLAATTLGRPILIRAEADDGQLFVWAIKGWGASCAARDRIVVALQAGSDPQLAVAPAQRSVPA